MKATLAVFRQKCIHANNMQGKAIDSGASGFLIILLPLAFVVAFLFAAWPAVLALIVLGLVLRLWQQYQWQQLSQQVNPFFHQMLQETRGRITALDLAMKANLSAAAAKQYLEMKAQEFGAQRRDYPDQGAVYYFITAGTLGSLLDDSESSSFFQRELMSDEDSESAEPVHADQLRNTESFKEEAAHLPKSLIQSELARRLEVHSSTVLKRRNQAYFPDWSRGRDPEGIAWQYSPDTKLFYPLNSELQEGSKKK